MGIEQIEEPEEYNELYSPIYFKIGFWYCEECGQRHHGLANACIRCHRKRKRKKSIKWLVVRDDYML